MPEACMLCIDTSNYMRNGDYHPSRILATQEACSLLVNQKTQSNPENTVGFLTMGGSACSVRETLTADVDRVMAAMTTLTPAGSTTHFVHGLQIAALALSHATHSRAEKRIVVFIGSPLGEPEDVLEKLAKRLRKDEVAVDIVAFGVDENIPLLEGFINTVAKNNNSHLLKIPTGASFYSVMARSAIVLGDEGAAAQAAAGPGADPAMDFGVDPNIDPELAMVLRMSLEEERRRQEAANAPAQSDAASNAPSTVLNQPPQQDAPAQALSEEEEFELALKMSEQLAQEEAARAAQGSSSNATDPDAQPKAEKPAEGQSTAQQPGGEAVFDAALDDPDFMNQLAKDVGVDPNSGGTNDNEPKKKDDK